MRRRSFQTDSEHRFEFVLTRELGIGTHRETMLRMTNSEFVAWLALYRREHDEREQAKRKSKSGGRFHHRG